MATKIKGQNLRVFLEGACIAEATSCQINVSGEMQDASTKDTTSAFQKQEMVSKSWNVTVDTLDTSVPNLRAMLLKIIAGAPLGLKWDQTTGEQNRTGVGASFARQGKALVSDFNLNALNRQNATLSIQFTGTGPLANVN